MNAAAAKRSRNESEAGRETWRERVFTKYQKKKNIGPASSIGDSAGGRQAARRKIMARLRAKYETLHRKHSASLLQTTRQHPAKLLTSRVAAITWKVNVNLGEISNVNFEGSKRKWRQKPYKASWNNETISLRKKLDRPDSSRLLARREVNRRPKASEEKRGDYAPAAYRKPPQKRQLNMYVNDDSRH